MPTPQDDRFVRFAVAGGYLSPAQAGEVMAALREIAEQGATATAPELLVRRGVVTEREARLIGLATASSKMTATVPRELGPFELLEPLGEGGAGTVFRARQKDLGRAVALKVVSPQMTRDKEFVERLRQEVRAAARLSHPNIVPAIDFGESDGLFYLATELVDGEPLAALLRREGRLPEARALAIATEVARALEHAHRNGIVHLGIRPANIVLVGDGGVRVTDFGIARAVAASPAAEGAAERLLWAPAYAAPELLRGDADVDWRADVFSLGAVLFEMLTGAAPFAGPSPLAVAAAALTQPLPPLAARCPETSEGTARLVERLTAKNAAARFESPADVVAAFEKGAVAGPTRAVAPREAPAPARRASEPAPARRQAEAAPARRQANRSARRAGAIAATVFGIAVNVAIFILLFPVIFRRCDAHRAAQEKAAERVVPTSSAPVPLPMPDTRSPVVAAPATGVPPGTATVPRGTTGVDARLVESLRSAVDAARDFAKRNPMSYVSQAARYQGALEEFAGPKLQYMPEAGQQLLGEVRAELQRVHEAGRVAAEAEVRERRSRAEALFKQGNIAEATRQFETFPVELKVPAVAAEVDRLRAHYPQRALDEFKAIDARAKKLIAEGKLAEARAAYSEAKGWQLPEVAKQMEAAVAAIDKLAAGAKATLEREAHAAYPKTVQAILDRLGDRDYAAANKLVEAALADGTLEAVRGKLRPLQPLVAAAAEAWEHTAAGLRATKRGEEVKIGGVRAKFVRVEGDKVYLGAESAAIARPVADLKPAEAVALALRAYGAETPEVEATLGLFLFADRDYREAAKRIAEAGERGADVAAALDLLARLAPRPCPTCKEAKKVPCGFCGGAGHTALEPRKCPDCKGTGQVTCPRCRGRRVVAVGTRMGPCPSCKEGQVPCKKCKGTGTIQVPVVCDKCKGDKELPCTGCGGTGELPPLDLAPPAAAK